MFGFEAKDYVIGGVAVAGLATGIVSHCRVNSVNKTADILTDKLNSSAATLDEVEKLMDTFFKNKKAIKKAEVDVKASVDTIKELNDALKQKDAELKAKEEAIAKAKTIKELTDEELDARINAYFANKEIGLDKECHDKLVRMLDEANACIADINNTMMCEPVQPMPQQPMMQPQPMFIQPQVINQPIPVQTPAVNQPNPTMKARIDAIDALVKKAEDDVNNIINKNTAEVDAKIAEIMNDKNVTSVIPTAVVTPVEQPVVVEAPVIVPVQSAPTSDNKPNFYVAKFDNTPNMNANRPIQAPPQHANLEPHVADVVPSPVVVLNQPIQKPVPHNNKKNNKKSRKH